MAWWVIPALTAWGAVMFCAPWGASRVVWWWRVHRARLPEPCAPFWYDPTAPREPQR